MNKNIFKEIIEEKVYLIASERNWIEGEALRQLEKTAELPGILKAVGLPDIHPGKGVPVGAAFISKDIIYPHLIGNDIGCGVGLWKTDLKKSSFKVDKWAKKLSGLENPWEGDRDNWLLQSGLESVEPDDALGTIGGGNHFAEIQAVHKVHDKDAFKRLGLDQNLLVIAVHSGSRGIGDSIFRYYAAKCGARGLHYDSDDAVKYLAHYDYAAKWAASSRSLIAGRMSSQLRAECMRITDVPHNTISGIEAGHQLWLHRKGGCFL